MNFESKYLGKIEFKEAVNIQKELWLKAKSGRYNVILGLEHPAVITLGRRAGFSEVQPSQEVIPVVKSSRGGLATLHSEGQLVIYPILQLSNFKLGVRDYVYMLLQATENVFLKLNVRTYKDDLNIGLYTERGKIAFCGLEIKNGISQHGISINISNDLTLFNKIKSCGFQNPDLDRLSHYRTDVGLRQFYDLWTIEFSKLLEIDQK
jgi:lipoyl(octanoyl) transferase